MEMKMMKNAHTQYPAMFLLMASVRQFNSIQFITII